MSKLALAKSCNHFCSFLWIRVGVCVCEVEGRRFPSNVLILLVLLVPCFLLQGQQRFSPSPYNILTGGRSLEPNYDISKYTPENNHRERSTLLLNRQMNHSLDNDNLQKFASKPVRLA